MLLSFDTHKQYFFETDQPDLQRLIFTLDSIATLFDKYFDSTKSFLIVSIWRNEESPMCVRSNHRIFLNVNPFIWNQAAYQFAHELCHYMIHDNVCDNLRWLEESICQTASYFFLYELTDYWLSLNIDYTTSDGSLYALKFSQYVYKDSEKANKFDVTFPAEIASLEDNCYNRDKNRHVANLLLPIFQKYPDTWKAIPFLCQIPPNLSLYDSLKIWLMNSPCKSRNGLMAIERIFFP